MNSAPETKRLALREILKFRRNGGSREHAFELARCIFRKSLSAPTGKVIEAGFQRTGRRFKG
jgi:hypothetical protein